MGRPLEVDAYHDGGWAGLVAAIIKLAVQDARSGKREAQRWIEGNDCLVLLALMTPQAESYQYRLRELVAR